MWRGAGGPRRARERGGGSARWRAVEDGWWGGGWAGRAAGKATPFQNGGAGGCPRFERSNWGKVQASVHVRSSTMPKGTLQFSLFEPVLSSQSLLHWIDGHQTPSQSADGHFRATSNTRNVLRQSLPYIRSIDTTIHPDQRMEDGAWPAPALSLCGEEQLCGSLESWGALAARSRWPSRRGAPAQSDAGRPCSCRATLARHLTQLPHIGTVAPAGPSSRPRVAVTAGSMQKPLLVGTAARGFDAGGGYPRYPRVGDMYSTVQYMGSYIPMFTPPRPPLTCRPARGRAAVVWAFFCSSAALQATVARRPR